jgi:hypothetical protein
MADKHIAHLTTNRTANPDEKEWASEPIIYTLMPIIERFRKGADLVSDEFRQAVWERLLEIPEQRDWSNLPPRPDLSPR